jgi:Glycosyltransferase family 87
LLHHLTAIAEKSVNSQGQEVWALNERSRTYLTFANWTIWLASVTGGLIFAINWVASGKTDVALCEYLVFIDNFWAAKPLYIMNGLHGFHYLPVMLVIGTPLGWVSVPVAGAIFGLLSIGFLAWSIYKLAEAIAPDHPAAAAGSILFASAVGATNSVLLFQMQTPMTAAMICAAVAGMSGRWRVLAAWLVVASAVKPLAIVMAMLAFVTVPQTRVPFIIGFAALLLIPFGFGDWNYLLAQYREYAGQLATITNAVPGHWYAQTEISTLLRALGLDLGSNARLAIRVGAAIGFLVLAWRIAALGAARATAFALLILATCYIGLFNPRQENVSFIVVAPGIAALAMIYLQRNIADWRGWIWITLAFMVQFSWGNGTRAGAWLYPGWMVLIWIGLLGLMINPRRWCDLLAASPSSREANSPVDRPLREVA